MDGFKNPEIVSNRLKDMRSLREQIPKMPCIRLERSIGAMRRTLYALAV